MNENKIPLLHLDITSSQLTRTPHCLELQATALSRAATVQNVTTHTERAAAKKAIQALSEYRMALFFAKEDTLRPIHQMVRTVDETVLEWTQKSQTEELRLQILIQRFDRSQPLETVDSLRAERDLALRCLQALHVLTLDSWCAALDANRLTFERIEEKFAPLMKRFLAEKGEFQSEP